MLILSVGDEVVLTSGEDAGSIGDLIIVNYGACLGPQAYVVWRSGDQSWLAANLIAKLVDDSASGLISASKAIGGGTIHACYSRSLEKALLDREFECHAARPHNQGQSVEFLGHDWTVTLHNGASL